MLDGLVLWRGRQLQKHRCHNRQPFEERPPRPSQRAVDRRHSHLRRRGLKTGKNFYAEAVNSDFAAANYWINPRRCPAGSEVRARHAVANRQWSASPRHAGSDFRRARTRWHASSSSAKSSRPPSRPISRPPCGGRWMRRRRKPTRPTAPFHERRRQEQEAVGPGGETPQRSRRRRLRVLRGKGEGHARVQGR